MPVQTVGRTEKPPAAEARLLKALSHPARLAILGLLREGEACVCHLEAALGFRQAYISQQLMVLREAGLVQDRRDGWNVFYHVSQPQIFVILDAARRVSEHSEPVWIDHPASRLENCSCPRCCPDGGANEG